VIIIETQGLIWLLYCNLPLDVVFRSRFLSLLTANKKKRTFLSLLILINQEVLVECSCVPP